MQTPKALTPGQLHPLCDPAQFEFTSTADVPDLPGIIGQHRALRALHFGMGVRNSGYNIFVLGPTGTGKATAVRQFIEVDAAKAAPAPDWIYLYNFQEPGRPKALQLAPGRGRQLREDLRVLIKDLQRIIPLAFESEDYIRERDKLVNALKADQEMKFQQLTAEVEKYSFSLIRLPGGFMLTPAIAGKPLTDEQFEQLSEEQKEKLRKLRQKLQEQVDKTIAALRESERQAREELVQLDERVARFTIEHPIAELRQRYADQEAIQQHLEAMTDDLVANADVFKSRESQDGGFSAAMQAANSESLLRRYSINLFIDNAETEGAPVILEGNPNFANMVGRIEHQAVMGALLTDFTMLRPGSLHRANGGYLVIDALSLLQRPQAWDALKRTLKEGEVRVEEYAQSLGLISTAVLEPQPIPLDVKVVLSGPPWLFYLFQQYEEDFGELFKVQADFDNRMPRNAQTMSEYAQFVATLCRRENLRHLTPDGVARVVDYSSRIVSDQRHLSTHFRDITDLITEASFWSGENSRELVTAADVQQAIDEKRLRSNLYEERLLDSIARGTLIVSVEGEQQAQINGLSVMAMDSYAFARPTRITARTFMGQGGIIDIEREVKLGGPIHSKGVMILAAFLGGRYAQDSPLGLRATLVFEQSYSGVEGDSASLAELCVLISALAQAPLRQDLAVTGSVNQHGEVQAVGGVNEKVEGFYDACNVLLDRAQAAMSTQGVILPAANVEHLVLRDDVVAAVREGRFHLYAVEHVDQALELLTGQPAGEPSPDGAYPPDSINGRVMATLQAMTQRWQELRAQREQEETGT